VKDETKTKAQLVTELAELRQKIAALEASAAGRGQLKREIAERRLYLESVLACAPDAIATMDAEHNILEWNVGAEKLFGYTLAEVIGRNIDTLIAGPATDVFGEATGLTRQVLSGESVPAFETVRYRKDGFPVNVIVSGSPILLEGKVVGVVAVYADITAQKRMEEALAIRIEQLTALSQASHAVTASLEVDQVLAEIISLTGKVTTADYTTVLLVDEAGRVGQSAEDLPGVPSIKYRARDGGLTEWIARSGQAVIIDEIGEDGTIMPPLGEGVPRLANPHIVEVGIKAVAGLPLIAKGNLLGVLYLHSKRPGAFRDQLPVLTTFARTVSVALENARLYRAEQRRAQELQALYDTALSLTSQRELNLLLPEILQRAVKLLQAESGSIYLVDRERRELRLTACHGLVAKYTGVTLKPGEGMAGQVFLSGKPLIVNDYRTWEGRAEVYEADQPFTAALEVPLKWQGEVIGVLAVTGDSSVRTFTQANVELATLFANQAAVAIENTRLYEAEQAARESADTLREVSHVVNSTLELDTVLSLVLRQAKRVLTYDTASILLFAGGERTMAAVSGYEDEELVKTEVALRLNESSILQNMARDHRSIVIADVRENEHWVWVPGTEEIRAWIGAPLLVRDEMIGVLMIDNTRPGSYTAADASIAQALANQAAIAIENARLYEAAQQEINERQQVEEALRASEEYARRIIDSSLDTIITVDMERRIVEFNRAAQGTFGYQAEEILGKHVDVLYADPQEGRQVHQTTIEQGQCVQEVSAQRKNGQVFPSFISSSILRDARGAPVGVMGVSRDVTESKQAEEALRRRNRELALLNRASQALASTLDLDQVLATVLEEVRRLLDVTACSIWLIEPETGELVCLQVATPRDEIVRGWRLALGQGICGWVALHGESLVVSDAWSDERYFKGVDKQTGLGLRSILTTPLRVKEDVIGVLQVLDTGVGRFDETDLELLEPLVASAAIAIENARLYEEARQRVAGLEALQRTSLQLSSTLELSAVLDTIAESSLSLVGGTDCHIYLYDATSDTFTFGAALWENGRQEAALEKPRRNGLTATVAREGRVIVINDTTHHPLYTTPEAHKWGVQAIAGFPLKRAGRVLGVFNIAFLTPHTFGEEELRMLGLLADQAASAIENARLYEETTRRLAQTEALREMMLAAASTLDFDQVLNRTMDVLASTLDVEYLDFMLPKDGGKFMESHPSIRGFTPPSGGAFCFPTEQCVTGRVYRTGQPMIIPDVRGVAGYAVTEEQMRSELAVPVKVSDEVVAVLNLESSKLDAFGEEDLAFYTAVAGQLGVAMENARLYKQAQRDAETKSTLLREVNHRVKNNLTAIIGLLYAERSHAAAEDQAIFQPIMQNLVNRVQGLATVHSMLSVSEWAPLSLSELVAQVIHSSLQMLPRDRRVSINVAPSPARVTPDQAHNLALVINELTTNTVKHGLQEQSASCISARIELDGDTIVLEFRDNGPGYPKEALRLECSNVGFDLIQNIVSKNLHGELSLHNDCGAVAVIRFKAKV